MTREERKNDRERMSTLNRERIVQAALELLNEVGIRHLSMRKLAEKLDVKAASLYWHVKNKSELLQWIADHICGKMDWPEADMPWREKIRLGMYRYREGLLRYRDAVEIFANTVPSTPNRLRLIGQLYNTVLQTGLRPEEAVLTVDLLNNYVIGSVMEEIRFRNIRLDQDIKGEMDAVEHLPPEMASAFLTLFDMEKRFQFGLQILLDGISARLKTEREK